MRIIDLLLRIVGRQRFSKVLFYQKNDRARYTTLLTTKPPKKGRDE